MRFPSIQAIGFLFASCHLSLVFSAIEEPCRDSFGTEGCCSFNFVQEMVDNQNLRRCHRLIPDETYGDYEGESIQMTCDPGFQGSLARCTWITPSGVRCDFQNTNDLPGTPCNGDRLIQLVGDLSQGICSISVDYLTSAHQGSWNCSVVSSAKYFDSVTVEVYSGLKTTSILAITIPIVLIVAAIAVTIAICCFCPALCASCACITAIFTRPKKATSDTQSQTLDSPGMSPPPPPTIRVYRDVQFQHSNQHYDTPSTNGTNSFGGRQSDFTDDSVLYTTANPSQGDQTQMHTARKVSNVQSVQSFGPRKASAFDNAHF